METVTGQPVQFYCRSHRKPGQLQPSSAARTCQRVRRFPPRVPNPPPLRGGIHVIRTHLWCII